MDASLGFLVAEGRLKDGLPFLPAVFPSQPIYLQGIPEMH